MGRSDFLWFQTVLVLWILLLPPLDFAWWFGLIFIFDPHLPQLPVSLYVFYINKMLHWTGSVCHVGTLVQTHFGVFMAHVTLICIVYQINRLYTCKYIKNDYISCIHICNALRAMGWQGWFSSLAISTVVSTFLPQNVHKILLLTFYFKFTHLHKYKKQ